MTAWRNAFPAIAAPSLHQADAIEAGISTRMIADQLGHARTGQIDTGYGSHTWESRVEHLSSVAEEINRKRNKTRNHHDKGT